MRRSALATMTAIALAAVPGTNGGVMASFGATQADAGWIIYQGPEGMSLMRPDGSGDTPFLTRENNAHHPDWSPDGSMIAFETDEPDGTTDIWVSAFDGSAPHRVVDCKAPCQVAADPSWSPDGTRLVYWSNGPTDTTQVIRVADASSGETVLTIAAAEFLAPINPKWSPAGGSLAVEVEIFEDLGAGSYRLKDSAIGTIDLTASQPKIELVTPDGMAAGYPDWSPDGARIVFEAGNLDPFSFTGEVPDLYTMAPDGTDVSRLTDHSVVDGWVALPDWTSDPDGPFLVTLIHDAGYYSVATVDSKGVVTELHNESGSPIPGAHPRRSP